MVNCAICGEAANGCLYQPLDKDNKLVDVGFVPEDSYEIKPTCNTCWEALNCGIDPGLMAEIMAEVEDSMAQRDKLGQQAIEEIMDLTPEEGVTFLAGWLLQQWMPQAEEVARAIIAQLNGPPFYGEDRTAQELRVARNIGDLATGKVVIL